MHLRSGRSGAFVNRLRPRRPHAQNVREGHDGTRRRRYRVFRVAVVVRAPPVRRSTGRHDVPCIPCRFAVLALILATVMTAVTTPTQGAGFNLAVSATGMT